MKLCKIAIDVANNNSAIATALYEISENGTRRKIPKTSRLWTDTGAIQRNSVLIPSVILYEEKNPGKVSRDCYGYDALDMIRQSDTKLTVRENIKYRLFVEDDSFGDNTEDFTNLAKYLLDCIQFDEDTQPDVYEIWVSHPVICDEDNLFHLENIINDALIGHPIKSHSIHFINEADCAFRFSLSDKKVQTAIFNTLTVKNKAVVLVCDIGGSTMELSLYIFTKDGQKVKYTSAGILRANDKAGRGLGSHAMDNSLRNKLTGTNSIGILDGDKIKKIDNSLLMLRWITPLKEDLNNRLRKGKHGSLSSLHAIAIPEKLIQNDTVDKPQFEQWCSGYTAAVCKQIKNLAAQAGIMPEEIDIAVLTGGGCELYPIESAIRDLLKPGSGDKACVLRPNDPSSILDEKIIKDNNPDYYNGLCPKAEISSLACVLGNLAEDVDLTMPVKPVHDASKDNKKSSEGNRYEKKPEGNVYKKKYSSFRPCSTDGFLTWFKRCETKGYSCDNYCECDTVCTKYTCSCVSECRCDDHCGSDYDCWCEREYG